MTAPPASRLPTRWDLWLPLAAVLVAAFLLALATTAARALRESRGLALEGLVMRQAHELERTLRETGPEAAPAELERSLRGGSAAVGGLALLSSAGVVEARAGSLAGPTREVELFLGRDWRRPGAGPGGPPHGLGAGGGMGAGFGGPGFQGGRRILRLALTPAAARPSRVERAVVPAAAGAGVLLVALSWLGGRLLVRQREEQAREAARRRLEGLGRAGAGLAHQLRNPLATLKGSLQLLLEAPAPGSERRLAAALGETVRMEALIGRLLDYARPPRAEPADVELVPLLLEIAGRADGGAPVRVEAGGAPAARADPEHLRQIVGNLVDNARAASPAGACVEVTARELDGRVEIAVADRGPGPGEDPERLFEPYVSGRADGTGLGLPIARALAEANGGSLALRPRPDGGALAVLVLPCGGGA